MAVDYDWLGQFARNEDNGPPHLRERLVAYGLRQGDARIDLGNQHQNLAEKRHTQSEDRLGFQRLKRWDANERWDTKQKAEPELRAFRHRQQGYREEALAWRRQNGLFNQQFRRDHQLRRQTTSRWRMFNGSTNKLARFFGNGQRHMAALPAPGGLAAIIGAIIILLLFVVPVNADKEARANIAFDVLRGAKAVDAGVAPTAAGQNFSPANDQGGTPPPPTSTMGPTTFAVGVNLPLVPGGLV